MNLTNITNVNLPGITGNIYVRNMAVYRNEDSTIAVICSEDNTPKWGWLKHVSISRADRFPSWEEILEIKEQLFGDVDCMMIMPKKEDYVNVHQFCFHVWKTPQEWGIQ